MRAGDERADPVQEPPDQAGPPCVETVLAVLRDLVHLKTMKDRDGETAHYRQNKDAAWDAARRVLALAGDGGPDHQSAPPGGRPALITPAERFT